MFYNETTRKIRAVAKISNISLPVHENTYSNDEEYYIDDPYEGELFIWIITLLGKDQFTDGEINDIWIGKRSKLQAVNYTVSKLNSTITVERGCWFSSH